MRSASHGLWRPRTTKKMRRKKPMKKRPWLAPRRWTHSRGCDRCNVCTSRIMFAGCHIGSGIGQRQRLNPLQDMKPIGVIGCCASEQDNESTGFSDLSNVVTVNWRPEARNLSHVWKVVASGSLTRPNWPRSQCQRLRSLTASAPWFVTGHEAHEGVIGCRASAQDDESVCTEFTDVSNVVTVNWRP